MHELKLLRGEGRLIAYYNQKGRYHSYTSWTNYNINSKGQFIDESGIPFKMSVNTTALEYMPQVGDFIAVETMGYGGIPDHTELIVDVDEENLTFTTIAGNTNVKTVCYKDYKYNTSEKMWTRASSNKTYVHGFMSPNYPD